MKTLAKYMAAQGRNGDDHLLHVSGKELAALQGIGAMVGRKVTTNPATGLPEAFDFASLIPAIVAIGGSIVSGGTLTPLMAGMISGAATTAATGSWQRGLAAGVGGGMMSGIGSGVSELGTSAAGAGLGGAGGAAGQAADYGMAAGADAGASSGAVAAGSASAAAPASYGSANFGADYGAGSSAAAPAASMPAPQYAGQGAPISGASAAPANTIANSAAFTPAHFSGSTLASNMTDTSKLSHAFGGWGSQQLGGNMKGAALAVGQIAAATGTSSPMPVDPINPDSYKRHTTTATYNPQTNPYYTMSDPYGVGVGGGEQNQFNYSSNFQPGVPTPPKFAGGGIAALPNVDSGALKTVRMIRSRYRSKAEAIADMQTPGSLMQQAGITDPNDPIMQYAFGYTSNQGNGKPQAQAPQYMSGGGSAGDGMSDSIPATIEGKQPARLAANEFVIPSDVVSHIGNGSSDAGADKLHAMMARIRKARTGSTAQAPAIDANKMMPA